MATKKYLRAVTKTTVTSWAESHWGFESLSYSILLTPNCQVQDRLFVYSFLLRSSYFAQRGRPHRLTLAWCVCLLCVCVPVSVGLCVIVALMSFEAVPIPQSAVSRPSPASCAHPRKVVALVCIRSCALQWFIKTLVWLEASTAAPSDTRERGTV